MNDVIDPALCSDNYAGFDLAVAAKVGQGALIAKCDINSDFRLLPMHPLEFNLLAFTLGGLLL